METTVDDEPTSRNSCRSKGAGKESAAGRRTATAAQADVVADAIGIRRPLMVHLGAYGPIRPEELAGLRRRDADLDNLLIRVRAAEPERTNGKRAGTPRKGPMVFSSSARRERLPPEASASTTFVTPGTPSRPGPVPPSRTHGPRRPVLREGRDDLPALRRRAATGDRRRSGQQRTPGATTWGFLLERVPRIELALSAREAATLEAAAHARTVVDRGSPVLWARYGHGARATGRCRGRLRGAVACAHGWPALSGVSPALTREVGPWTTDRRIPEGA